MTATPRRRDGMTEAERVMYGMTFTMDPEPHVFRPCPGAAYEFCRECANPSMHKIHRVQSSAASRVGRTESKPAALSGRTDADQE